MRLHHRTRLLIVLALALLLQALMGMRVVHGHPAQLPGAMMDARSMSCHGTSPGDAALMDAQHPGHAANGASAGSDLAAAQADCDHLSCCLALAALVMPLPTALKHATERPTQPGARLHGEHTLPELRPPI